MKAPSTKSISTQLTTLEQDQDFQLTPGSVKSAMKDISAKSRDLWMIEPSKLQIIENLNVRVVNASYIQHIRELADSMKANGFYQDKPLAGYVTKDGDDNSVVIIYEGHSRLKAALLAISEGAEFTAVPVSVNQVGVQIEDVMVSMFRGNTGRELTPYEKALMCKRFARFNWDIPQIAEKVGLSKQQVKNYMTLMEAPFEIRELVVQDRISATRAIEMIVEFEGRALEKIKASLVVAEQSGKERSTKRFVPGAIFKKVATKSALPMYEALNAVHSDKGFARLSAETRSILDELMQDLYKAKMASDKLEEESKPEVAE